MRQLAALLCVAMLSGCAANGFKDFYKPYMDLKASPNPAYQLLGEKETPTIMSSNNFNRDVRIAKSKHYWPIGYSSFNGEMGTQDDIISQARDVGASMVFVSSQFAETRAITTNMVIPTTQTTLYSGTTNGNIYGNNGSSADYNSTTTGVATTNGSKVVPVTRYQQRFNQEALFFVKVINKPRLGVYALNLTPELRAKYERNTGVIIDVVREGTPAFEANILPDDVLIELNGVVVTDGEKFSKLVMNFNPKGGKCTLKILRGDSTKVIDVQINPI